MPGRPGPCTAQLGRGLSGLPGRPLGRHRRAVPMRTMRRRVLRRAGPTSLRPLPGWPAASLGPGQLCRLPVRHGRGRWGLPGLPSRGRAGAVQGELHRLRQRNPSPSRADQRQPLCPLPSRHRPNSPGPAAVPRLPGRHPPQLGWATLCAVPGWPRAGHVLRGRGLCPLSTGLLLRRRPVPPLPGQLRPNRRRWPV